MEVAIILSTVFSTGAAAWFAWRATLAADRADHSAHALERMRGRVAILDEEIANVSARLTKIVGKVYREAALAHEKRNQPLLPLEDEFKPEQLDREALRAAYLPRKIGQIPHPRTTEGE